MFSQTPDRPLQAQNEFLQFRVRYQCLCIVLYDKSIQCPFFWMCATCLAWDDLLARILQINLFRAPVSGLLEPNPRWVHPSVYNSSAVERKGTVKQKNKRTRQKQNNKTEKHGGGKQWCQGKISGDLRNHLDLGKRTIAAPGLRRTICVRPATRWRLCCGNWAASHHMR